MAKPAVSRARAIANDIVASRVSPVEGANRIYGECFEYNAHLTGDEAVDAIGWFGGLADEWEEVQDSPEERAAADARIIEAAAEFLRLTGPTASSAQ